MNSEQSVLRWATIRINRGVSLEQIAEATKISIRALRAIETGDFKKLPGGIYNTSYIRQYAEAIDCDAGMLLDYYYRQTGIAPPDTLDRTVRRKDGELFGGLRPSWGSRSQPVG